MAPVSIAPAQPPLPTARNLPFQFSAGIHSSISMCESEEGARTAATRQCAGNAAPAPRPRPAGAAPAGRNSAAVMAVLGRESVLRPSHADCCWAIVANKKKAKLVIMAWEPQWAEQY